MHHVLPFAALAIALGTAACSDSTSPAARPGLSVSFSTAPATAGATLQQSAFGPRFSISSSSGSDTLVIDTVQVVFSKMELASASSVCSGTTQDDCPEMHLSPILVSLPLTPGVATPLSVPVPAGSYTKLEAKIDAVEPTDSDAPGTAAFVAANPSFQGVSVRVTGRWNGQAFTYTTNAEAELELAFSPAMVVDSTGMNLTVNIDVANWFRSSTGTLIDPSTAGTGGANYSVVADNIKRSFKVYEDDNRDGKDDNAP